MRLTEELQRDVLDELAWDPRIDASKIAVTASGEGVITLAGSVGSHAEKHRAEKAARRIRGVHAVANDLEVALASIHQRLDSEIAEAAVRALSWNTGVPVDRIQVTVENAWITLEGDVDWQFQKRAAEDAVRDLEGVRGVSSIISIQPRPIVGGEDVRPSEIKRRIADAFERSAQLDADRVTVQTDGGQVILMGTVQSWGEKDEAEDAAWATAGVTHVENRLEIAGVPALA